MPLGSGLALDALFRWPVPQIRLGHAKLDTTALYTQVATNVIRAIMSPLDRLAPLTAKRPEPPA